MQQRVYARYLPSANVAYFKLAVREREVSARFVSLKYIYWIDQKLLLLNSCFSLLSKIPKKLAAYQ